MAKVYTTYNPSTGRFRVSTKPPTTSQKKSIGGTTRTGTSNKGGSITYDPQPKKQSIPMPPEPELPNQTPATPDHQAPKKTSPQIKTAQDYFGLNDLTKKTTQDQVSTPASKNILKSLIQKDQDKLYSPQTQNLDTSTTLTNTIQKPNLFLEVLGDQKTAMKTRDLKKSEFAAQQESGQIIDITPEIRTEQDLRQAQIQSANLKSGQAYFKKMILESKIEQFNKKYGDKELTEKEFEQAEKEQDQIQTELNKYNTSAQKRQEFKEKLDKASPQTEFLFEFSKKTEEYARTPAQKYFAGKPDDFITTMTSAVALPGIYEQQYIKTGKKIPKPKPYTTTGLNTDYTSPFITQPSNELIDEKKNIFEYVDLDATIQKPSSFEDLERFRYDASLKFGKVEATRPLTQDEQFQDFTSIAISTGVGTGAGALAGAPAAGVGAVPGALIGGFSGFVGGVAGVAAKEQVRKDTGSIELGYSAGLIVDATTDLVVGGLLIKGLGTTIKTSKLFGKGIATNTDLSLATKVRTQLGGVDDQIAVVSKGVGEGKQTIIGTGVFNKGKIYQVEDFIIPVKSKSIYTLDDTFNTPLPTKQISNLEGPPVTRFGPPTTTRAITDQLTLTDDLGKPIAQGPKKILYGGDSALEKLQDATNTTLFDVQTKSRVADITTKSKQKIGISAKKGNLETTTILTKDDEIIVENVKATLGLDATGQDYSTSVFSDLIETQTEFGPRVVGKAKQYIPVITEEDNVLSILKVRSGTNVSIIPETAEQILSDSKKIGTSFKGSTKKSSKEYFENLSKQATPAEKLAEKQAIRKSKEFRKILTESKQTGDSLTSLSAKKGASESKPVNLTSNQNTQLITKTKNKARTKSMNAVQTQKVIAQETQGVTQQVQAKINQLNLQAQKRLQNQAGPFFKTYAGPSIIVDGARSISPTRIGQVNKTLLSTNNIQGVFSDSKINTNTATLTGTITGTDTSSLSSTRTDSDTLTKTGTDTDTLTRINTDTDTLIKTGTDTINLTKTRTDVATKTRTDLTTKTKTLTLIKPVIPTPPPIKIKTPPFVPGLPRFPNNNLTNRKQKTRLYVSQVRTQNNSRWKTVSKPKPYNKAFNKGFEVADNTIAQSVRNVYKKTANKFIPDDPGLRDYKFRNKKYKSKIPSNPVKIEKRAYAIDTPGEKKGLSVAKYLAQKKDKFKYNKRVRLI